MKGAIEHRLDTPFGDICWFEWNEAGEGPTLLLLHATGFHARIWDQVIAHLPETLHVVAPDQLSHGRSFKPESVTDWTDSCLALLPLLDKLSGRPLVAVGHSMGGYVLTRLAAERPHLFQHILLIDPVIFAPSYYRAADEMVVDPTTHPVSRRRNHWDSAEQMMAHFAARAPYSTWDPAVLADYCRYGLLPSVDGEGFMLACPPRLEASIYQNAQRTSPYDWAGQIQARTTILRAPTSDRKGEMDFSSSPTWPGAGKAFGAEQDILWAANSHFIPMESPAETAALIANLWVQENPAPQ